MTTKRITQREAQALRRRVADLETREQNLRATWASSYPDGTHFASVLLDDVTLARVATARRLGHAIVATHDRNTLNLYALPVAKDTDA
jgi:hypothetical protein